MSWESCFKEVFAGKKCNRRSGPSYPTTTPFGTSARVDIAVNHAPIINCAAAEGAVFENGLCCNPLYGRFRESILAGEGKKKVQSHVREIELEPPRDRAGTFDPQVVKKRQRNISGIEQVGITVPATLPLLSRATHRGVWESKKDDRVKLMLDSRRLSPVV